MAADGASNRTARMSVRRYASSAEADLHDVEFWMQIPVADRILLVWRLSQEQWRLRDDGSNESGLCRSVASVRRG